MFILTGSEAAVSFTDDTSPNLSTEPDRRVSIHAQVIRETPLDWYYDILKMNQGITGELKSDQVLANFSNSSKSIQDKIWAGMKTVRLSVVDTLPHQAPYVQSLKDALKRDDALDVIKDGAKKGDDFSKRILQMMSETTTKMVIESSPAKQFMWTARFMRNPPGTFGYYLNSTKDERYCSRYIDDFDFPLETLEPEIFGTKPSTSVTRAVKWTSKSGSLFNYAIDELYENGYYGDSLHYQYRVYRSLRHSHAFDDGDDQAMAWMGQSREEVLRRVAPQVFMYHPESLPVSSSLQKISSDKSYFTQASDIAAGFARQFYEREGIVALAINFEHVTFNGFRISQNEAEEKMRKWKQMGYIKPKDNTIYISSNKKSHSKLAKGLIASQNY